MPALLNPALILLGVRAISSDCDVHSQGVCFVYSFVSVHERPPVSKFPKGHNECREGGHVL